MVVLAELPEKEQEAQLDAVADAVRRVDRQVGKHFLKIGQILYEGVYGGDISKIGNRGNRGDSLTAVATRCGGAGWAVAGSETALRRFLDAYLAVQELDVEPAVAAQLGVVKLADVHRKTDEQQKAAIGAALSAGDVPTAKTTLADATKTHNAAVTAAKASPPPVVDSATDPSNDARDEAAEQLAAKERREVGQKAAKVLLNQAFAAALAAGLTRVLVDKMLSDAFGDD